MSEQLSYAGRAPYIDAQGRGHDQRPTNLMRLVDEPTHTLDIELQPGDVLLYRGTGFWSWGIRLKTWGHFSHVEVYDQDGTTLASRDNQGVNRYVFTNKNLWAILRPVQPPVLNLERGRQWFREDAKGQPYDWVGLFAFFSAKAQGSKKRAMFCSEFGARFFKKCGYVLFHGDSDAVSPGNFWHNPLLTLVWAHDDLPKRDVEVD